MNFLKTDHEIIVIGVSTGGFKALEVILSKLPEGFNLSVIIVQHRKKDPDDFFIDYMNKKTSLHIKEAEDKESIKPGVGYIAPPEYHLLVEMDHTLSLSVDPPLKYARPSIDMLFETAAEAYESKVAGVILTGANDDGSKGLKKIRKYGGMAIIQDPVTAEAPMMPKNAIKIAGADHILSLANIGKFLGRLS
ncbi:MAG: chemotaxis protein CheB [Desulfobacteraceae bacterium]|nr:chemotaxis protein CheB [Desulfobacteraceae bacterium]